jgi:hypothetical protein
VPRSKGSDGRIIDCDVVVNVVMDREDICRECTMRFVVRGGEIGSEGLGGA